MGREGKVMRDWTRRLSRGMTQERRERLESEIWVLGLGSKNQPWATAYQYLQWSMNQQKVSNERYNPSLVLINTFIIQPARNISDVAVDRHLLLLFTQVEVDSQDAAVLNLSGNWFH